MVLLAHQGRPGSNDFTSLENHAEIFSEVLGFEVKFVPDITGEKAITAIRELDYGEVLLLDNVRFVSDECISKSIEEHAKSTLVKTLGRFFDYFVLDGFAVSHRYHASVVGFATVIPSTMGMLMEREVRVLSEYMGRGSKNIVILGGSKVNDAVKYIEKLIESGRVEKILLTGLVAFVFHIANGLKVSNEIKREIMTKFGGCIPKAKELLKSGLIELPADYAIDLGERKEILIDELYKFNTKPKDIGINTVYKYVEMIDGSSTVCIRGPAGVIEKKEFELGTRNLLEKLIQKNAKIIFCGGHLVSVLNKLNIDKSNYYISTAGGAALEFIAKGTLAGIEALKLSKKIFGQKVLR